MSGMQAVIPLNSSQLPFCMDLISKHPAFCGGFGSGKTYALIVRALNILFQTKKDIGYFMPNYPLIRSVAYPKFLSFLIQLGLPKNSFFLNQTEHDLKIHGVGKILFRSLDNPLRSVIGYEVAHSFIDELDRMERTKAKEAFREVVARTRLKNNLGFCSTSVGTTPEGFGFVYEYWKKEPKEGFVLYRGSTYDNEINLDSGYIKSIKDSYPEHLCQAYLHGKFVNLNSKNVYHCFSRNTHVIQRKIPISPQQPLLVGMDFNIGDMSAVIGVMEEKKLIIFDSLSGFLDTPELIQEILNRFGSKRKYFIFPDASCGNRVSIDANITNLNLLKRVRNFQVFEKNSNPLIQDRVNLVNNNFEKNKIEITQNCSSLIQSLEQQAYNPKTNKPEKTGIDNILDAFGYLVYQVLPISIPRTTLYSSIRTV